MRSTSGEDAWTLNKLWENNGEYIPYSVLFVRSVYLIQSLIVFSFKYETVVKSLNPLFRYQHTPSCEQPVSISIGPMLLAAASTTLFGHHLLAYPAHSLKRSVPILFASSNASLPIKPHHARPWTPSTRLRSRPKEHATDLFLDPRGPLSQGSQDRNIGHGLLLPLRTSAPVPARHERKAARKRRSFRRRQAPITKGQRRTLRVLWPKHGLDMDFAERYCCCYLFLLCFSS